MNPGTLAAIRALDDARLWQLLVLVDDFGWPVAKAWLTRWQNGRIPFTNEKPPGGNRGATVSLAFDRGATRQDRSQQACSRRKHPQPSRGSYV